VTLENSFRFRGAARHSAWGKNRIICKPGVGQHGVASATAWLFLSTISHDLSLYDGGMFIL